MESVLFEIDNLEELVSKVLAVTPYPAKSKKYNQLRSLLNTIAMLRSQAEQIEN